MPFYRVNGLPMHIKFSGRGKPPAPCVAHVGLKPAAGAWPRCCDISAYLCDWPTEDGRSTCDAPLCAAHAHEAGRNRHHCPEHHRAHLEAQPQLGLFTRLAAEPETER